ncbi:MAG: type II toxin-antitoxin system RelE/ParE family toxin [Methylococcaceae bacterium]|nr:type II toxin-antitoxin system RelE/ParE family toxin [Methylococcaceae bacterium]
MRKLDIAKRAERFLKILPPKQGKQIAQKLLSLLADPYPVDSKKLVNTDLFRVDSGEYRIIYAVSEAIVQIILVGKRNDDEVYRKLRKLT